MNNAKVTVILCGVAVFALGVLIWLNRDKFTSAAPALTPEVQTPGGEG